jgi:hypothetical protein
MRLVCKLDGGCETGFQHVVECRGSKPPPVSNLTQTFLVLSLLHVRFQDTKAGFGICMDKDAAADSASKGDWYTCKMPPPPLSWLSDPFDTSCIAATKEGSESACKETLDADGFHCSWCPIGKSGGLCLNDDQISIAEKLGETCGSGLEDAEDPYDPACIAVTFDGDESSCGQTLDASGTACEWCTIGATNLCLNRDQAQIAEQVGGSCGASAVDVSDPYDPSCIAVTLGGDESTCKQTMDADGSPCEWCSIASNNLCLNGDQAQILAQFGGSCGQSIDDPYDPSCVAVSIGGDESTCKQTMDADGSACKWCSVGTTSLCLNADQAHIAEQVGGSCTAGKMDRAFSRFFPF